MLRTSSAKIITYTCSHLPPPIIVSVVVALGEDIVLARLEAGSMIEPWRFSVRRSDGIDPGPEVGITGDEMSWRDPRDGS